MKLVYKPLEFREKTSNKPATPKTGNFKAMLDQHLKITRNPKLANTTQNLRTSQQLGAGDDITEGLDSLKDLDSEYYSKGIKKKTLAETFSARNKSGLNSRIQKYKHLIQAKAKKYGLDPNLLASLVRQESNFNPYAVSYCGAMGLGQLMPETARYLGVKDPFNASQNLDAAAKYLKEQLDTFGNVDKALAAYNAGPGAVKRYGGIPPYRETQNYVRSIRSHYSQINRMNLFAKKSV